MKNVILLALFALATACSHPLEIIGEGDIHSIHPHGHDCLLEDQPCENIVTGAYHVTFQAKARPGWRFVEWQRCPELQLADCRIDVDASHVEQAFFQTVPSLTAVFEPAIPQINDVTDTTVFPDLSIVTITGSDLLHGVTLAVNDDPLIPIVHKENEIQFVAPDLPPGTYTLDVIHQLGGGSYSLTFLDALPGDNKMITGKDGWTAIYGMAKTEYDFWATAMSGQGQIPIVVNGYNNNGASRYNAVFLESLKSYTPFSGFTLAEFNSLLDSVDRSEKVLSSLSAHVIAGEVLYSGVFVQQGHQVPVWAVVVHKTSAEFQAELHDRWSDGYLLTDVTVAEVDNTPYFSGTFQKISSTQHVRWNLTEPRLEASVDELLDQHYELEHIEGYFLEGEEKYIAIWAPESESTQKKAGIHGLTSRQFKNGLDNFFYQGSRPIALSGFGDGKKVRFAAVAKNTQMSRADLDLIDETITSEMEAQGVGGLSIAISKDQSLLWAKGYGLANQETGEAMTPNHVLRQASISKTLTAAAVMKMLDTGELSSLDRKVFGDAKDSPILADYGIYGYQSSITEITVRHLLEMSGGFWENSDSDFDIMWDVDHQYDSPTELIDWALGDSSHSLNQPGTSFEYSNFSYMILGRVIEELSKKSYEQYVQDNLLAPIGVESMGIGSTKKIELRHDEARYYHPGDWPYAMDHQRKDAEGGWIAKPIDLLRFLTSLPDLLSAGSWDLMISRESGGSANYKKGIVVDSSDTKSHSGSLPGTDAGFYIDYNGFDMSVVVNENDRNHSPSLSVNTFKLMRQISNGVTSWPDYDMF